MKYLKIIAIISFIFFTACTDVISVEVPFEGSRLIIEASLDWEKGTLGNEQTIKLSLSSAYFDETNINNGATGASVQVTNRDDGSVFVFTDTNNTGEYITTDFVPLVNNTYTLEVIYEGETYIGEETLLPLTGIKNIEQTLIGGIDPEVIDLQISFDDPVDEENYYLLIYYEHGDLFPFLDDTSDEFRNGNTITDVFEKREDEDINQEPLESGDLVDIELLAISKSYFEYINLLIAQTQTGNNPFSAVPVTLKGNCINITNPENSPFGYFRVTDSDKITFTIR